MWGEGTSRSKSRRRKEGKYERRDDDARVGGGGRIVGNGRDEKKTETHEGEWERYTRKHVNSLRKM